MKNNKVYNYDEVVGSFNSEVVRFQNEAARNPNRDSSKKAIYEFASKIYQDRYKDAVSIDVLNQYKC